MSAAVPGWKRWPVVRDVRGLVVGFRVAWRAVYIWNVSGNFEDMLKNPLFEKDAKRAIAIWRGEA